MKEGWHLDKKVPISIIIMLLLQTITLVIWATRLDSRVSSVEATTSGHTIVIEAMRSAQNSVSVGLARIEERQSQMAEGVKDIKNQLNNEKK